jgi:hypothetical protein
MSLPEPLKAAVELAPAGWLRRVVTPGLLMVVIALSVYIYADRRADAATQAAVISAQGKAIVLLETTNVARAAHEEDRDRRLRTIERAVREIQRDLATAVGNDRARVKAQRALDAMPDETR